MSDSHDPADTNEEVWRWALTNTHHGRLSQLPSTSRCTVCRTPFAGLSGLLAYIVRRHPSKLNPHICNYCEDVLPLGGAEIDVAILFADVRGSTELAESMSGRAYSEVLTRFYKIASKALIKRGAIIDKLIGDEVMAFFVPAIDIERNGLGYRFRSVRAAVEMLHEVGYRPDGEPWLPLAVGVHAGDAWVGKLGTDGVHTFTTVGDTVNVAARLRSEAEAGEILIGDDLYDTVEPDYPWLSEREVSVKGKSQPLRVHSLRPEALSPV